MSLLDAALRYAELGHPVFPLAPGTKVPLEDSNGLKDATTDPETIRRWWTEHPDANIGIRCDHLAVVDPDVRDGKRGPDQWRGALVEHGHEPDEDFGAPVATTPSTGSHIYFALPEGFRARQRNGWLPGVDIKAGDGAYVVAPPSRTRKGPRTDAGDYVWVSGSIEEIPLAPPWILDAVRVAEPEARGEGTRPLPIAGNSDDWETIVECLACIGEPHVSDYDDWVRVGNVVKRTRPTLQGLAEWDLWSQQSPKHEAGVCEQKWPTLGDEHPNPVGIGTLVRWAGLAGDPDPDAGESTDAGSAVRLTKSRKELLALVNRRLKGKRRGVVIDQVLKIGEIDGEFVLVLGDGRRATIGNAGRLCTQSALSKALADLGYVAPKIGGDKWPRVAQAILDLAEVVEAESEADEFWEWIEASRSSYPPVDVEDESTDLEQVTGSGIWVWFSRRGQTYVRLQALQNFIKLRLGAYISHTKLSRRLVLAGFAKKRPKARRHGKLVDLRGYLEPEERA